MRAARRLFSWYTYSPLRLSTPACAAACLSSTGEARSAIPVEAWAEIVSDPERTATYRRQRARGGFVRAG